jgi:sec-independent protein translocase protein TatA
MFGLGMPELLIIFLIALVVFGAAKLPQIGKSLGGAIREFKKSIEKPSKEMTTAPPDEIVCSQCRQPLQKDWIACPHCGLKQEGKSGA